MDTDQNHETKPLIKTLYNKKNHHANSDFSSSLKYQFKKINVFRGVASEH